MGVACLTNHEEKSFTIYNTFRGGFRNLVRGQNALWGPLVHKQNNKYSFIHQNITKIVCCSPLSTPPNPAPNVQT